MLKPHIYYNSFFKNWFCIDIKRIGKGKTPFEAYKNFMKASDGYYTLCLNLD